MPTCTSAGGGGGSAALSATPNGKEGSVKGLQRDMLQNEAKQTIMEQQRDIAQYGFQDVSELQSFISNQWGEIQEGNRWKNDVKIVDKGTVTGRGPLKGAKQVYIDGTDARSRAVANFLGQFVNVERYANLGYNIFLNIEPGTISKKPKRRNTKRK